MSESEAENEPVRPLGKNHIMEPSQYKQEAMERTLRCRVCRAD